MQQWTVNAARLAAALWISGSARADVHVIQPGPEGEDVAPYAFLPELVRGDAPTLYAFTELQGHAFESYLRIALPAGLLAAGEIVTDARLVVTYAFDFGGFGETSKEPGRLELRPVLAPWSESSLTWNARPMVGAPISVIEGIDGFQTLSFDVTALARSWTTGAPNHGFSLTSPTRRVLGFHSFESSAPPALRPLLIVSTGQGTPPDADGDLVPDATDSCPMISNPGQQDTGGVGADSPPDGIGDACQCGDVSGDGRVTVADAVLIARSALTPPTASLPHAERCDVGGAVGCSIADAVIIRRALLVPPAAALGSACTPSTP